MFRGDAAHSGVFKGDAPKSIHHVLWEFKTGGRVFSSPVVANGIVYVGSNDHFLHAIDAGNGREVWKFQTEANVNSSPAVANGAVYFLSLDGSAYSLDAHTGKQLWRFKTGGESRLNMAGIYGIAPSREVVPDVWDFFLSSPAVDGGTVYFGSGDHNIYALDALTGSLLWKVQAGDVVHSSPAIANGVLYIGCWDGVMVALNAKTGQPIWNFATGVDATHFMQGIPGSAAIADGIVVFGSRDNNIYALDAKSGKELWRQGNSGSWVIASPAIIDGVVYITTSDTMKLRALNLKTGVQLFDLTYKSYSFSSPAVAAGHTYFGTFDGAVYDADLTARKLSGEFRVQASLRHKELLTEDGHLNGDVIYGPLGPDGKPNNTIDAAVIGIDRLLQLGSILSSPAVANGVVYVGSADGSIYALD
ncbi:MAG: PQQ-binding-like beta-propeller repeat protein [Terracidiphilus sp.]|jgi:outer membrane protein assembly factor BamB